MPVTTTAGQQDLPNLTFDVTYGPVTEEYTMYPQGGATTTHPYNVTITWDPTFFEPSGQYSPAGGAFGPASMTWSHLTSSHEFRIGLHYRQTQSGTTYVTATATDTATGDPSSAKIQLNLVAPTHAPGPPQAAHAAEVQAAPAKQQIHH